MATIDPLPQFRPAVSLWESRAQQAVLDSLRRARTLQQSAYASTQRDIHDLYDGEHYDVMVRHFRLTHQRVAQRWNRNASGHRYLNVLGMMVRTLSVVFHRPPLDRLVRAGVPLADDDPIALRWAADKRSIGWAATLRQIDAWTVLFKTILVQPAWVRGRLRWLVEPAYQTRVDQDPLDPAAIDTARAVHVELPQPVDSVGAVGRPRLEGWQTDDVYGSGEAPLSPDATTGYDAYATTTYGRHTGTYTPSIWTSWTRAETPEGRTDWGMFLHQEGAMLRNPLFADNVNRYGGHPFVVFRDGPPAPGEFWLPARNDWLVLQRWLDASLSDEAWGLRYQTWGVPFAKGWHEDDRPSFDPGEVLVTEDADPGTELKFLTPATNLTQLHAALDNALRWAAVAEGLPADVWTGLGATRNLGAKKMDAFALQLRREERVPTYVENVRHAFEISKAIVNWHEGYGVYPPDVELELEPATIPYPVDEVAEVTRRKAEYELGLDSPVRTLMERHGLTREQASERHRELLEECSALHAGDGAAKRAPGTPATAPDAREEKDGMRRPPGRPAADVADPEEPAT